MDNELRGQERLDDLQIGGYEIIQDPGRFCFGMDAVLLSGFAKATEKDTVLDLGCGNGVIPILLAAKTKSPKIYGLEIQPENVDMAVRSVKHNGLEARIEICEGDIKEASAMFGAGAMDVITTNPPYMIAKHGLVNPNEAKAIARHEILCNLEDVVRESSKLLRSGGHFYMVHRPFRLTDILCLMRQYRMEPKRLRMVYPFADKEPTMVLIEGLRDGNPGVKTEAPLIIYETQNQYSKDILEIYEKGGEERT